MESPIKKTILPVALFLVVITGWMLISPREKIVQPINYSHKIHIEQAELECADCHVYVETNARASIPNIDICSNCHSDEPISDSPEEVKLLKYISNNQQIPWVQIYDVPDHVYFSHRRHVKLGGLECKTCHGNVPELEEPAPYQLVEISMNKCVDCHRDNDVVRDCIGCHY